MRYIFGDCEFDSNQYELRRNGEPVSVTKQTLDILALLLENPDRLITKDELVDHIWGGRAITDAAITVRLHALRKAIGDSGAAQRMLKTVRGLGVRFVADVKKEQPGPAPFDAVSVKDEPPPKHLAATGATPPKLAVLPFAYVGAESPHEFLAGAVPDDMITAMSRLHSLTVIARASSFRIPSFTTELREVRERTHADYCTSGQLEFAGDKMFLSIELAETQSENVLWRDRIAIDVKGAHEVRADIVQRVARELDQHVTRNELLKARIQVPGSLNAWQNFHSGFSIIHGSVLPDHELAEEYFDNAIDEDSRYARAYAGLASVQLSTIVYDWRPDMDERSEKLELAANRAYFLDPLDPYCIVTAARLELRKLRTNLALEMLEKAIELTPSDYQAHGDIARLHALAGQHRKAKRHLAKALELHPLDHAPIKPLNTDLIIALSQEDIDQAVACAKKVGDLPMSSIYSVTSAMTAYHLAGQDEMATKLSEELLTRFPGMKFAQFVAEMPGMTDPLRRLYSAAFSAHGLA